MSGWTPFWGLLGTWENLKSKSQDSWKTREKEEEKSVLTIDNPIAWCSGRHISVE